MARPIRVTVSGTDAISPVIPLNTYNAPSNLGIGVKISSGASLTYTVEHTFDDVFAKDFNPSTAVFYPYTDLQSKIGDEDGNYLFPVTGIRIKLTAWGSGSATMTIVPAGY